MPSVPCSACNKVLWGSNQLVMLVCMQDVCIGLTLNRSIRGPESYITPPPPAFTLTIINSLTREWYTCNSLPPAPTSNLYLNLSYYLFSCMVEWELVFIWAIFSDLFQLCWWSSPVKRCGRVLSLHWTRLLHSLNNPRSQGLVFKHLHRTLHKEQQLSI